MSEWKPIETAPKDGDHMLTYSSKSAPSVCVGYWDGRVNEWMTVPGVYARRPTHWMPLPSPPHPLSEETN